LKVKTRLLASLIVFSVLYGFFFVNYIDLNVRGADIKGYHLWLTALYFVPFFPLLLQDLENWRIFLSMGLLVSLMNNLFYYPSAIVMFGRKVDLWRFYMSQLGFMGWMAPPWSFDYLLFRVRPYSWLKGFTVYVRMVIIGLCWVRMR